MTEELWCYHHLAFTKHRICRNCGDDTCAYCTICLSCNYETVIIGGVALTPKGETVMLYGGFVAFLLILGLVGRFIQ